MQAQQQAGSLRAQQSSLYARQVSGHSASCSGRVQSCSTPSETTRLLRKSQAVPQQPRSWAPQPSVCADGWQGQRQLGVLLALAGWQACLPQHAAAAETVPLAALSSWLDQIDSLGPAGPLFFVCSVAAAEMIPLFPTQPLSLAGGLAFGAAKGSVLVLSANATAAVAAFTLSRTLGKRLAQRIIDEELGESEGKAGVQNALGRVQSAIEKGTFLQQCTSVLLLRLTPIVPFSASNYLLGLTPLGYPAFLIGSLSGMAVWATVYASLGGAGRSLLQSGVSLDSVFAGIQAEVGTYSEDVAVVLLGLGLVVLFAQGFKQFNGRAAQDALAAKGDKEADESVLHAKE